MTTDDYRPLVYPDVPPGWLYCASCGSPMKWLDIEGSSYRRDTGERYKELRYTCSSHPGLYGHDDISDGRLLASYTWSS